MLGKGKLIDVDIKDDQDDFGGVRDENLKVPIRPITRAHPRGFVSQCKPLFYAIYEQFRVPKSIEGTDMEGGRDCTSSRWNKALKTKCIRNWTPSTVTSS